MLVPLAAALLLEPARRGWGTHQRLGLPPCTFVVMLGHRCPVCGMTTSWAHLVRGELTDALRANVGGTLCGVITLITALWLLASAARRRWLGWVPNGTVAAIVAGTIGVVTLMDWGVRLMIG